MRVKQRHTLSQSSLAACWGAQNCRATAAHHHALGVAEDCRAADAHKLLRSDLANTYPISHLQTCPHDDDTKGIICFVMLLDACLGGYISCKGRIAHPH